MASEGPRGPLPLPLALFFLGRAFVLDSGDPAGETVAVAPHSDGSGKFDQSGVIDHIIGGSAAQIDHDRAGAFLFRG